MFLVLLVILVPLFYIYYRQNEWFKKGAHIPGPRPWPILGNTFDFALKNSEDLFQEVINLRDKFGRLYRMYIGTELWLVVSDPKDLEALLSNQKLLLKSNDYTFLAPWIGTGLLTSTGKKWHSRRKTITPAFHFKILEQFLSVIDQQVDILVAKWKNKPEPEFEINEDITLCAMDIICETSMGVSIQSQANPQSSYYTALRNVVRIAHCRMFNAFLHYDFIFKLTPMHREFQKNLKIMDDFNNEIIAKRRKELESRKSETEANGGSKSEENEEDSLYFGKKRKMALMDILLQSELTDQEVREEVNTFMFAGHDTVSSALMFLFYNLAKHPEVQEKCLEEIQTILGSNQAELTYAQLSDLHYLECVIKESLRIFPPVPMFGRESQEDIILESGTMIPKGTNITLCPYLVQTDPAVFPDPHEFKPERFLSNESSSVEGFSYIPFSAGPRNCIGQRFAMLEMKIVTARVLSSLSLKLPVDHQPVELTSELVLKPRKGIKLHVTERK